MLHSLPQSDQGKRLACLFVAMLLSATAARADKIVLKNGRQISAYNVVDEGDKVRYETSAGQLTLPKSIVDHIETGEMPPVESAAAALNLGPPASEASPNSAEIDRGTVHDGGVDREYIARLENATRTGGRVANERAALAHHAAAQFESSRGDFAHALNDEDSALTYMPEQPGLLIHAAYLHLRQSEFKLSLEYLEKAKRVAPSNADVYKLAGWAYYGMNRLDSAVEEWTKAQELRPDADTRAALEKVQRDRKAEENYRENESAHFELRYDGSAEPGLAREVLHTLEGHFEQIESELNYTPREPIGVVLYTRQAFADITRAPGWVSALNDGRIRVPVQGLTGVNSELSRVLRHELTHSFVRQKTHGRAPVWVQEGLAQWMEGKRSDRGAAVLVEIYEKGQAVNLGRLEGSWMSLPRDAAGYSYSWALANTEYIVEKNGMSDLERILDHIAEGSSTEQALKEVLHDDYSDLMQSTAEYLKKTYVR